MRRCTCCTDTNCCRLPQPKGDCFPPWNPLLIWLRHPARVTHNFKLTAGAAAPLSDFTACRKIVLKRRKASLDSVRPRSMLPRVCRNSSCKLLSHALAALTALRGYRRVCCWLAILFTSPTLYAFFLLLGLGLLPESLTGVSPRTAAASTTQRVIPGLGS